MQRGSSVNFQPIKSAGLAVSHASREVQPQYLLPPDKTMGTIVLLDDKGNVASTLEAKLAIASRQAKRQGDYSPLWEGVINLRSPKPGEDATLYKKECSTVISNWCDQYQKMTGHKVLRADIHLDEGRLDKETGEILFNAHAHVMCDKTNDLGRVLKVNAPELRKIQDFTAELTGLQRGENSLKTGRKHITHQAYKALAELGRLEVQKVKEQVTEEKFANVLMQSVVEDLRVEVKKEQTKTARIQKLFADDTPVISNLKAELAQLKAQIEADYKANRAAMVASKTATQADYKALKEAKDKEISDQTEKLKTTLAELKTANQKVETMTTQITQLEADKDQLAKDLAQAQRAAVLAENYQAEKAKGTPAHLIVPDPVPRTSQSNPLTPATMPTEPPKRPMAPVYAPTLGNSIAKPTKSLKERLNASWDAFVAWIKEQGPKAVQELVTASSSHEGPVVELDDFHAVQSTGRGKFAIHELGKLDQVPDLDNSRTCIKYQDGLGRVTGGPSRSPKAR